jgi:hypothetical protein
MLHQSRSVRDRGAETVEWGAALLIIATIAAVLVTPVLPGFMKDYMEYAVCRVVNFDDPGSCETPADKDLKPDSCLVALSVNGYGGTLDVAFVRVGKDLAFIRAVDSNGKVTITAVRGDTLGVQGEVGAGVNWGNAINVGANASADASIRVGEGDSWTFDSAEEADQFVDDIQQDAIRDTAEDSIPVVGWLGRKVVDTVDPLDIPDPTITRYEVGIDANAGAGAGISIGPKPKDDGKNPSVSPNLGVNVGINAGAKATVERNNNDGSTAIAFEIGGGANANGTYVIDGKRVTGEVQGRMKLSYDANGNLTGLELRRAVTVNDEAVWTTTTLPITNDAERQAVYQHLGQDLASGNPVATPLNLTWDDFAPVNAPGADSSPLQRLLYEKGETSRVTYGFDSSDSNYGASVALGLKLGANVNINSRNLEVRDAEYLGAPGPGGQRQYRNFEECRQ